MLYTVVYGDKYHPSVDVILCDEHPERDLDGTFIFHGGGESIYLYAGDYLSVHPAYFGGKDAEPENLYDIRAIATTDKTVNLNPADHYPFNHSPIFETEDPE